MRTILGSATALGVLLCGAQTAMAADPLPAVVAIAPAMAPVVFAPPGLLFVARAGAWGGYRLLRSSDDPDNNNHLAFGADAAINIPIGMALSIQPEVRYWNYRDPGTEAPLGGLVAGGHVSWRNPDRMLVGIFAAATRPYADTIDNDTPGCCTPPWGYVLGAEAQLYAGQTTFYLQAGYGNIVVDMEAGEPEGFVRGWFGQGEVRRFLNDNLMIAGRFGLAYTPHFIDATVNVDAGVFYTWGLSATMRLGSSPILVALGYDGALIHATEDEDFGLEHTFAATLTLELGGADTLFDNDRRGVTLTLPTAPARVAAWVPGMD